MKTFCAMLKKGSFGYLCIGTFFLDLPRYPGYSSSGPGTANYHVQFPCKLKGQSKYVKLLNIMAKARRYL